jgi:hypothetical protein
VVSGQSAEQGVSGARQRREVGNLTMIALFFMQSLLLFASDGLI